MGTDFRVWSSDGDGWGDPVGNQQSGGQDVQSLDSQTTYDFVGSVTKIWGQHTFKAGVDARRMYDNHWELLYDDAMYQGWATDPTDDNALIGAVVRAPAQDRLQVAVFVIVLVVKLQAVGRHFGHKLALKFRPVRRGHGSG